MTSHFSHVFDEEITSINGYAEFLIDVFCKQESRQKTDLERTLDD